MDKVQKKEIMTVSFTSSSELYTVEGGPCISTMAQVT